jgi:guanine deaminase
MKHALRGAVLSFTDDPFLVSDEAALSYESDAIIRIQDGRIRDIGPADRLLSLLEADEPLQHYPNGLILPGFIDCHVHYPQTQMIASYGEQLLEWLEKYAFPAERQFQDKQHARNIADLYLSESFRNGITTAAVYCTIFPQSVDALFEAAEPYNMRLLAGKVMMDRNAPEYLRDTPLKAYDDSLALISRWHKKKRFEYAITPRFAPTSTSQQLEICESLAKEYPDMVIQSHVSENTREVAWVKELFPEHPNYSSIYAHYNLLRPRAVYGHGIHLLPEELDMFRDYDASIAHCPTSNLFVGSGCFDIRKSYENKLKPVRVGLATDVGGGDSFSMLQTMREAYKIAQLNGYALSVFKAFYLATRGAAKALHLDHCIGSLQAGMEADMIVLDMHSTPFIEQRMHYCESFAEQLFVQMILGDDRAIDTTIINGQIAYKKTK